MSRQVNYSLVAALACLITTTGFAASTSSAPNPPANICVTQGAGQTCVRASAAASNIQIKWHPGHYALSDQLVYAGNNQWSNIKAEIDLAFGGAGGTSTPNANPNVIGYMGIHIWSSIEGPTAGSYNWANINQARSYIAANYPGKRYAVMIWAEDFRSTDPANSIPNYILTDATYGAGYDGSRYGYWQLGTFGSTAAVWNSAVEARIAALFAALASQTSPYSNGYTYDTDPYFEAVTFQETSLSFVSTPGGYPGLSGAKTQWQNLIANMVASFPHTLILDQQNYWYQGSPTDATSLTNADSAIGAASSSPDVYYPQASLPWGPLSYLGVTAGSTNQVGKAPSVALVEDPDYGFTSLANITFSALTTLKASHVFWEMQNWDSAGLLTNVNANPIPSGNQVCPSYYSGRGGCNSN